MVGAGGEETRTSGCAAARMKVAKGCQRGHVLASGPLGTAQTRKHVREDTRCGSYKVRLGGRPMRKMQFEEGETASGEATGERKAAMTQK